MQHTLSEPVILKGIGVHSGQLTSLTLQPAPVDAGITWIHMPTGEQFKMGECLPLEAPFATVLATAKARISTIEHVMAALWACGITNVVCELHGDEAPILDGSSHPIIEAILVAGIAAQNAPVTYLTPTEELTFADEQRGGSIVITPARPGQYELVLQYDSSFAPLGTTESKVFAARTFGNLEDLEKLHHMGLARGSSLENSLAFYKGKPLNEPRFENEPQLHKMLDLIGDLYLLGRPLIGTVHASKTGHSFNRQVIAHFLASPEKWFTIKRHMSAIEVDKQSQMKK